jgi:hypothetical protein
MGWGGRIWRMTFHRCTNFDPHKTKPEVLQPIDQPLIPFYFVLLAKAYYFEITHLNVYGIWKKNYEYLIKYIELKINVK